MRIKNPLQLVKGIPAAGIGTTVTRPSLIRPAKTGTTTNGYIFNPIPG